MGQRQPFAQLLDKRRGDRGIWWADKYRQAPQKRLPVTLARAEHLGSHC
jgi:hypothetical protein